MIARLLNGCRKPVARFQTVSRIFLEKTFIYVFLKLSVTRFWNRATEGSFSFELYFLLRN
jgi:hypothetical protein